MVGLLYHADVQCSTNFALRHFVEELCPLQIFCNDFLSGPYLIYYLTYTFNTHTVCSLQLTDVHYATYFALCGHFVTELCPFQQFLLRVIAQLLLDQQL